MPVLCFCFQSWLACVHRYVCRQELSSVVNVSVYWYGARFVVSSVCCVFCVQQEVVSARMSGQKPSSVVIVL